MDSSAVPRAVDQVFGIPELLEAILLQLPDSRPECQNYFDGEHAEQHAKQGNLLRALLLSQRVNSTFQNTITGSPALQRILFFSPTPEHPAGWGMCFTNPMLGDRAFAGSRSKKMVRVTFTSEQYDYEYKCTLWVEIAGGGVRGRAAETPDSEVCESWRRMLLVSIPEETVYVYFSYDEETGEEMVFGTTMGQVVDGYLAFLP
ncbi:hypothetical protein LTR15_006626 [Elasticomyces elasticus]|nr:hypothetical protein LTR15_006626 [Elasticomyces elasticus]